MAEVNKGRLRALRVVVRGDVITRLPPRALGGSHGVRPRVVLHPSAPSVPSKQQDEGSAEAVSKEASAQSISISYHDDGRDDYDVAERPPRLDVHAHTSHALLLSGESIETPDAPSPPASILLQDRWPLLLDTGAEQNLHSSAPRADTEAGTGPVNDPPPSE